VGLRATLPPEEDTPTHVTGEGGDPPLRWYLRSHWHHQRLYSRKGARELESLLDTWQIML